MQPNNPLQHILGIPKTPTQLGLPGQTLPNNYSNVDMSGINLAGDQPQLQAQPTSTSTGNTALDWILTMGGGLAGAVGGGALGGPLGLVAGGAGGQTLGRGVANILEGKSWNQNLIQEAESGALGGALGLGVGQLASPILGKILGVAGEGAATVGEGILKSQFKIPASLARNLQLGDTVSQLAKYGVTNINKIPEVASLVTGDTGILSNTVRDAIGDSAPIDIGGILKTTKTLLDSEPLITKEVAKNTQNILAKGVSSTGSEDVVGNADPLKLFDFVKQLESKASTYAQSGDAASQALARVYRGVSNEIKDRLFASADTQAASNYLTPDNLAKLKSISPKLADEASSAQTIKDLRSLQAPFVRGSKLAGFTQDATSNSILSDRDLMGAVGGGLIFGGPGAAGGYVAEKLLGSSGVKSLVGSKLLGIGGIMEGGANIGKTSLGNILSSRGGALGSSLIMGGNPSNNANNNNEQQPIQNNIPPTGTLPQMTTNVNSTGVLTGNASQTNVPVNPTDVITGKASIPDSLPSLATAANTIPNQPYPPEQYQADVAKIDQFIKDNPGNPYAWQYATTLMGQYQAKKGMNDQVVNQYIASHKIDPETEASMQQAPQTYDLLTRLRGMVSQKNGANIMTAALNDNPAVQYTRSQQDPVYAEMNALLTALNANIAYDMVHGRLSNFDLQRLKQLPTVGTTKATALGLLDQAQRNIYSNYTRNLPRYGLTQLQGQGTNYLQNLGITQ